jgi:integrase
MECVRLRVKDVDFGYTRITVRDGKGAKDRVTMLPVNLATPLERHLAKVKAQHEQDLEDGFGEVYLPDALARKYKSAAPSSCGRECFAGGSKACGARFGSQQARRLVTHCDIRLRRTCWRAVMISGPCRSYWDTRM